MLAYYRNILKSIQNKGIDFENTYVIIYAHLLPSTVEFFKAIIQTGFRNENVFILGKSYSTIPVAQKKLEDYGILNIKTIGYPKKWGGLDEAVAKDVDAICKIIKKRINSKRAHIITMESGAVLRESIYANFNHNSKICLSGVEITMQGNYTPYIYPTIDVAACKAKKELEVYCVANNLLDNIERRKLISSDMTYGILGYGAIGREFISHLKSKKCRIICFDINEKIVPKDIYASLKYLLENADCIIGTTGFSSLNKSSAKYMKDKVILVSTSSKDTEFRDFLLSVKAPFNDENIFADLEIETIKGKKVLLLNGGFPINYNRIDAADESEMMMTYGLWFVGILLCGKEVTCDINKKIPMKKEYQKLVVENWIKYFGKELLPERLVRAKSFLDAL